MEDKRKIIIVTDGDTFAQRAIETATENIGGRCISRSGGNPTPLPGSEIVKLIKKAKYDPVVVMVDDRGDQNKGKGEKALFDIVHHRDIEVLGIVAVAANTEYVDGVKVDFSVTCDGEIVDVAVNKNGDKTKGPILYGDTVDIIRELSDVPLIVGIGDPGKMGFKDDCEIGAPIITKALEEIISRSGLKNENKEKH